jgi:xanthine dehydrogenase accessory factor
MENLLDQIEDWFDEGRSVALATVIKTWGSSPRPAGAMMAITDQGEISGSVSGGCVESAVIDAAQEVLDKGSPTRLHFGVANEEAWEVGLSCGGEIDVFVRAFTREELDPWREAVLREERYCIALVIKGSQDQLGMNWFVYGNGETLGVPTQPDLPPVLLEAAKAAASDRKSALISVDSDQIQEAFLQVVELPRKLVLVGGVHIAIPLASLADTIGFEVIVIDPRRLFSTTDRFPAVKRLLGEWPQEAFKKLTLTESTAVVMLTHDPKIDDPAIKIVLDSPVFYIGALGSQKTHQKRLERLTAQGVEPGKLKLIHAPVGLNLGATTPEEIALAVMAEIVQVWHQQE